MVLKRLLASRRAYADEYAVRVNRAVEVLAELAPADAVRTLRSEFAMSERQTHPPASSAPNRAPITHARNTRRLTRPGSPGNSTTKPGQSPRNPSKYTRFNVHRDHPGIRTQKIPQSPLDTSRPFMDDIEASFCSISIARRRGPGSIAYFSGGGTCPVLHNLHDLFTRPHKLHDQHVQYLQTVRIRMQL